MELRYRLLELCISRLGGSTSDGIILLDRRGNPIKASDKAQAALNALSLSGRSSSPLDLSTLKIPAKPKGDPGPHLPDWLSRNWLEPIVENGQKLGSILTIPNRGTTSGLRRVEGVSMGSSSLKNEAFERVIGKAPKLLESIACAQRLAKSTVPRVAPGRNRSWQGCVRPCDPTRQPARVMHLLSHSIAAVSPANSSPANFSAMPRAHSLGRVEAE